MGMAPFHELIVWRKSLDLAKRVYGLTATFPNHQRYSLCDQMERASVSIMSNIAEGSRRTKTEWLHFLRFSLGSASELDAQLRLSMELGLGNQLLYPPILKQLDEVSRILSTLLWKSSISKKSSLTTHDS